MVTVLVTSFFLLAVIAFAIYRWQRVASNDSASQALPPAPVFKGLFEDSGAEEYERFVAAQSDEEREKTRRELIARAVGGDKDTLLEAHGSGDVELYDEVLNALVNNAKNAKQVFSLTSYIARNGSLTVNVKLAESFTENWKLSPDRRTTSEMLHVAALAGDAAFYHQAISLAQQFLNDQRLRDMTPQELAQLIESEFWLIPANERNSGAGFLLKQELAKIRRELTATTLKP